MDQQVHVGQGDQLMRAMRGAGDGGELRRIADDLRRMYDGGAWHGPSVREALDGVTAGMAVAPSLPGAHTIYELAHHIAAWVGEVTRRLGGAAPGDPADGDFPPKDAVVDEAAWAAMQQRVADRHAELEAAILAFDPARLDALVGTERNPPLGTGMTYRATLYGVIEHDAYHAGQIVLLRKALG